MLQFSPLVQHSLVLSSQGRGEQLSKLGTLVIFQKNPFFWSISDDILPVSEHKNSKANTFQFAICVFLHFFSVRLSPEARWPMKIMEKTDIGIVFQNPEPFLL